MHNIQNRLGFLYENWKASFCVFFTSSKFLLTLLHFYFWYVLFINGHRLGTTAMDFFAKVGAVVIFSGGILTLVTIFLVLFSFYFATERTSFLTVNVLILLILFLIAQLLGAALIIGGVANNN